MTETVYGDGRKAVVDLVSEEPGISLSDARFCAEKSDRVIVYRHDSGAIVGCATFRLWGKDKNKADAYLYVSPAARGCGVGGALLKALTDAPESGALRFISTKIETDHARSLTFFEQAGFEKWYTELILCHSGERQPESGLRFINYQSAYFERYVDTIRRSFHELRQANDFEPYDCCEPDEAKKNELERNKDHIYLLLDGERIAASVTAAPGVIEDVFVAPCDQGRGIGRQMMRFALNKAMEGGAGPVRLSAIEWNYRALRLYESVGFRVEKRMHYLRLFPGKATPPEKK